MKKTDIIPNALTSANMLFGFLSLVKAVEGHYILAGWLIVIAGVMDVLDGKIARKIKGGSRFGTELDSLADMASFGVTPAVLAYMVYFHHFNYYGFLFAMPYIICGAFRLARFNTFKRKDNGAFIGLPIPAAAATIAAFINFNYRLWGEVKLDFLLFPIIAALCFLMVSNVRYDGLPKFNFRESSKNRLRLILLIGGLILLVISPATLFFPLCVLFILEGAVKSIVSSLRKNTIEVEIEEFKGLT